MPHLDPDRLILIAFDPDETDDLETGHLAGCDSCRGELAGLRQVAAVGAETQGVRDLPPPPSRVWDRIEAQLSLTGPGGEEPAPPAAPAPSAPAPPAPAPSAPGGEPDGRPAPHRVRPTRRRRDRARLAVVAAVALLLGIGGTVVVTEALDRPAEVETVVTAQAELTPPEAAPVTDAWGEARVLDGNVLHLHVAGLTDHPGYYEVWLINPDTGEMFSIGVLGDEPDVLLPLPTTVDLEQFRLVDVSEEHYDGDTSHSGVSLVRGTLTG